MATLYRPQLEDLWFRQEMLADPQTMAYNHAWGGTIPFPREKWQPWYDRWVAHPAGKRFYRYVLDAAGRFVGEAAYHYDEKEGLYLADVIIHAPHRGRGYGGQALEALCRAARENGVAVLCDNIAIDNPAAALFLRHGFVEAYRTETIVMLKKQL